MSRSRTTIAMTFLGLLLSLYSKSQDVEEKYIEVVEAYKSGDFHLTASLVDEIKQLYKKPPPKIMFLEIKAKMEIIKADPFANFSIIENTRRLTRIYLEENKQRKNNNYASIEQIRNELLHYPKTQTEFNAKKNDFIREQERIKDAEAKEEAERIAKKEKEAEEERIRLEKLKAEQEKNRLRAIQEEKERAEGLRLENLEKDKIAKEQAVIEQQRLADLEKQRAIEQKKLKRQLVSFRSLGFQTGEIATFGVFFESGGRKAIGFHMGVRSSMTPQTEILNNVGQENKTEVELGLNIKILKRLYMNLGAGYGFYEYSKLNEYAGVRSLEKVGYVVTSARLMIRVSRVININGGASFMDIYEDFYRPEITAGISFNLRKASK